MSSENRQRESGRDAEAKPEARKDGTAEGVRELTEEQMRSVAGGTGRGLVDPPQKDPSGE